MTATNRRHPCVSAIALIAGGASTCEPRRTMAVLASGLDSIPTSTSALPKMPVLQRTAGSGHKIAKTTPCKVGLVAWRCLKTQYLACLDWLSAGATFGGHLSQRRRQRFRKGLVGAIEPQRGHRD